MNFDFLKKYDPNDVPNMSVKERNFLRDLLSSCMASIDARYDSLRGEEDLELDKASKLCEELMEAVRKAEREEMEKIKSTKR